MQFGDGKYTTKQEPRQGFNSVQAGLGRPAEYKNGTVVDAALGLRAITYVARGRRGTWAAQKRNVKH